MGNEGKPVKVKSPNRTPAERYKGWVAEIADILQAKEKEAVKNRDYEAAGEIKGMFQQCLTGKIPFEAIAELFDGKNEGGNE